MKDGEVTLKVPALEDASSVLKLLRQINNETSVVMIPHLDKISVSDEEVSLEEINERSDCFVLLAVLNQVPVGIVTITKLDGQDNAGELGVAVLKKYWSQGIGSLLIDEAIYWFENFSSIEHLVLDVFSDNQRAIHLYEKFNFVKTGQVEEKDSNGKKRLAWLMEYCG